MLVYRNGNVSCIEALIQASNHETNDDDVDGRTPLLLACLHGHHQAVQVLLSLGGDVTKRLMIHTTLIVLRAFIVHAHHRRELLLGCYARATPQSRSAVCQCNHGVRQGRSRRSAYGPSMA